MPYSLAQMANAVGINTGSGNISYSSVQGDSNQGSFSDFDPPDALDSIFGYNNIDENTTETYTATFTGASGSKWHTRIRPITSYYTWTRSNTNITLGSQTENSIDVTGAEVTDDPSQNFVTAELGVTFKDDWSYNFSMTNYDTEITKTINVYDTYGGTGVCFLPGTRILMADGKKKRIEELFIQDEVVSTSIPGLHDENNKDWVSFKTSNTNNFSHTKSKVVNHWWAFEDHYYKINGGQLKVTGEHPLFLKRGDIYEWVEASSARIGDFLVRYVDGGVEDVEIETIDKLHGDFEVVSIDVEDIDVYYANGFLVHNKGTF